VRCLIGEKKLRWLRERTGLDIVKAMVRGNTGHAILCCLSDGSWIHLPSIAEIKRNGWTPEAVDGERMFEAGDPPPEGYLEWCVWAEVQQRNGLQQERCGRCSLYRFPQELSGEVIESTLEVSGGFEVKVTSPVCLDCEAVEVRDG